MRYCLTLVGERVFQKTSLKQDVFDTYFVLGGWHNLVCDWIRIRMADLDEEDEDSTDIA